MTVTMTVAGNSESTVYMLDGTPSTKTDRGPERDDGERLHQHVGRRRARHDDHGAGPWTRVERRSIEADGTMKVQTTITMMQGKPAPPPPPGLAAGMVLKRVQHPWRESSAPSTADRGGAGGHPGSLRR